jgi:hypothetical protein
MMAVRRLWLGKALKDPAFLLMELCHAAESLSLIERGENSTESLTFKNEAIKIINQRLDQSPNEISEGTLSTVASIVSYEVRVNFALLMPRRLIFCRSKVSTWDFRKHTNPHEWSSGDDQSKRGHARRQFLSRTETINCMASFLSIRSVPSFHD